MDKSSRWAGEGSVGEGFWCLDVGLMIHSWSLVIARVERRCVGEVPKHQVQLRTR